MAYKNIDLGELGAVPKITYVASRVALFVPKLVARLSTKLVVNPITKITTGQSYEEIKSVAVDATMQDQNIMADEMQVKIDEGKQNLEDWKSDEEYYIGNIAMYKSYEATVNSLVKKQTKLRQKPRRLLVGKNYLSIMKNVWKKRSLKRKELKESKKMIQNIINEYQQKQKEVSAKELEVIALEKSLRAKKAELESMQQSFTQFKNSDDNYSIIEQYEKQVNSSSVSSVSQEYDQAYNETDDYDWDPVDVDLSSRATEINEVEVSTPQVIDDQSLDLVENNDEDLAVDGNHKLNNQPVPQDLKSFFKEIFLNVPAGEELEDVMDEDIKSF